MAIDTATEGILPPITKEPPLKAPPKEPIAQPTVEEAKKPGLLKRFLSGLGKKQEAVQAAQSTRQLTPEEQAVVEDRRTVVKNMPTKHMVRNFQDSERELTYFKTISSLTDLTPEEIHRKAILTAQNELQGTGQPLSEAYVAVVENRLKAEVEAKKAETASPEPVGAGTKS